MQWRRAGSSLSATCPHHLQQGLLSAPSQGLWVRVHFYNVIVIRTLQMKGRWESYINVWVPFMYSQKWNCYFQNRIILFCLPVHTLVYLWEIYMWKYVDQSWEYIKRSQTHVEIGTEAAQFPEKDYKNGISLAVYLSFFIAVRNTFPINMFLYSYVSKCLFTNNTLVCCGLL